MYFDENESQAFNRLKELLVSEDVMFLYADASSLGVGPGILQEGTPNTMISRTLTMISRKLRDHF